MLRPFLRLPTPLKITAALPALIRQKYGIFNRLYSKLMSLSSYSVRQDASVSEAKQAKSDYVSVFAVGVVILESLGGTKWRAEAWLALVSLCWLYDFRDQDTRDWIFSPREDCVGRSRIHCCRRHDETSHSPPLRARVDASSQ